MGLSRFNLTEKNTHQLVDSNFQKFIFRPTLNQSRFFISNRLNFFFLFVATVFCFARQCMRTWPDNFHLGTPINVWPSYRFLRFFEELYLLQPLRQQPVPWTVSIRNLLLGNWNKNCFRIKNTFYKKWHVFKIASISLWIMFHT